MSTTKTTHDLPSTNSPILLEDFRPVGDSIEWRVGGAYWRTRGLLAFTSNEVPNLATNDGTCATRAAEVLFTSCRDAARGGRLEPDIKVVEMGIGQGLHARLFLDRFRSLCAQAGEDFYTRLTYYATDLSPKMLADAAARGTLANHPGRVRLALLDATAPARFDDMTGGPPVVLTGVRAVFHTYLLDTLPFTVLTRVDGRWLQLYLRTRIDDTALARASCDLPLAELAAIAASADPGRLLPLYELFRCDRAFIPVEPGELPFGEHIASFLEDACVQTDPRPAGGEYVVHSYGALRSLTATLEILRDDGFLLFHDYGATDIEDAILPHQHQRYGASRSMGVNYPLLRHVLARLAPRPGRLIAPADEGNTSLHARLVCRTELPAVEAAFRAQFSGESLARTTALVEHARTASNAGNLREAQAAYAEAHRSAPENWSLLVEWSAFATFKLRDLPLGVDLASRAVAINPSTSTSVWNQYGDALYEAGRFEQARDAFHAALAVTPEDPRTHLNIAWLQADEARFPEAIASIGRGLALDLSGAYRRSLLGKLTEILERRDGLQRRRRIGS